MEAPLDSQAYENDYHETKNETVCKQCETVCNKELHSFVLFTFRNFHEKRHS